MLGPVLVGLLVQKAAKMECKCVGFLLHGDVKLKGHDKKMQFWLEYTNLSIATNQWI